MLPICHLISGEVLSAMKKIFQRSVHELVAHLYRYRFLELTYSLASLFSEIKRHNTQS